MKIHELKCYPEYYEPVVSEKKRFEIRYNDRNYEINDYLLIKEYGLNDCIGRYDYTGRYCLCKINYVLDNIKYLQQGYVCLSIVLVDKFDNMLMGIDGYVM